MFNVRAEEKIFSFRVATKPGVVTTFDFPIKNNLPLCVKSIRWNYSIPPGVVDDTGYGWPKLPLEVSIDNLCSNETSSPCNFTTPVVMRVVNGSALNRSHLPVDLILQVSGLLISGDISELSDYQIASYSSLDSAHRSLLAFPQLLGSNFSTETPALDEKPLRALTNKVSTEDTLSLMIGDLFQLAAAIKLPAESITQLAEALIKKGWAR